MFVDRESLLQKLRDYGTTGGNAFVSDKIASELENSRSLKVPPDVAMKVADQLLLILQNDGIFHRSCAWFILSMLGDRTINSFAFEFMEQIRVSNILAFMGKAIELLSKSNQEEVYPCLNFLGRFLSCNAEQNVTIYKAHGVIESILLALDTKYVFCSTITKKSLLNSIFATSGSDKEKEAMVLNTILRCGGLRILHKVLKSTVEWALATAALRPLKPEESEVLVSLEKMINRLYVIMVMQVRELRFREDSQHLLDFTERDETTSHLYRLFIINTGANGPLALSGFLGYIHVYFGIYCYERVLMYSESSGVPFIVLFLRATQCERFNTPVMQSLKGTVLKPTRLLPAVKALVDQELAAQVPLSPAPVSDCPSNESECRVPGCHNKSSDTFRMLKCSRCKKVRYCCKDHQVFHWKEHKQVCGK